MLSSISLTTPPAVKKLLAFKKADLNNRDEKYAERTLKFLNKSFKKNKSHLDNLEIAIKQQVASTKCVTISR